MASLQTIREVTYRGKSEGLDKLAADLNKVSAATDKVAEASEAVAKVTETTTKRQLSAGSAYERLLGQIDPAFRAQQAMARGQATLDRALEQGRISSDQYAASLTKLQARYAQFGAANNNLVGQTGNLAAQFNDIGVQLAGGQSPFLIALQQGTQISQVLGEAPGGARGAVKALGGAFMSLISPVNIATIATIALGGAAIQYFTSTDDKLQSLDDKLKAHADLIKDIKDAYGEAAKGIDEYAAKSGQVLEQQLRASMDRLKEELDKQAKAIARSAMEAPSGQVTNIGTIEVDLDSVDQVQAKYEAFNSAIARLREGMKAGTPDIRGFQIAIAEAMKAAGDDKEMRKMGDQLIERSKDAERLEERIRGAERSIRLMSGAAGDGIGDLDKFGAALKALSNIGLPNLTDQQKALQEYRKAIEAAGGREDRVAAQSSYDAAIARANLRDAEKAAEEARKEAERNAEQAARKAEADQRRLDNIWAQAVDRIGDQTRALEQQAATYGMSAGEVARYRVEQELTNAAIEAQRPLTDGLKESIATAAQRAADAADNFEKVRQSAEWSDMGGDALKGFISDLRSGKDAGEAFLNVMERIADKLLDMSIDWMLGKGPNPFASIMQMFGGSGAGGSLPSMAAGTGLNVSGGVASQSITANVSGSLVPQITHQVTTTIGSAVKSAADMSRSAVEAYVRSGALSRGMDPDIIARGIRQESGFNPFAVGDNGKSFGVMQLYTGGGLGNEAMRRGISLSPENWQQQVDFSLDYMKRNGHGQWYGFRDSGIRDPWAGINRNGPQAFNGSAGNDSLVGGMGSDMRQLSGNFDQLSQSMSSATPEITQGLTSLSNVTQQGGQAVGGALKDTAGTIGEGANGVGSAIQQLMQALSRSGGGSLSGFLGLFSKGGGDWSDTSSWTIGDAMTGVSYTGGMHDGGLVGRDWTFKRLIHPAYFDDAPRYHSGLRPDEVPAILQQGEWVLSRDDVAAIRKGGSSAGGVVVKPTIINNTGAKVETETRQNADGSIDILTIIDERAKGAVRKDARRNGPLSRELGAGFNGRG